MPSLSSVFVRLNSNNYRLARQSVMAQLGMTARNWTVEHPATAQQRDRRPDVSDGPLPGDKVLVINDWSKGITGDRDPIPGTYNRCYGWIPWYKGRLRKVGKVQSYTYSQDPGAQAAFFWKRFKNEMFLGAGKDVWRFDGAGLTLVDGPGTSETMGALIRCMEVFNGNLYVGQGPSTVAGVLTTLTGTITTLGANIYLDKTCVVRNDLWASWTTNGSVKKCATGDDPALVASWGGTYQVGDTTDTLTAMVAYAGQVACAKANGLYIMDADLTFPNVLESMQAQSDPRNGYALTCDGANVFYQHASGLIRYSRGEAEEIGWQQIIGSDKQIEAEFPYGGRIRAMTMEGRYLWVAVGPDSVGVNPTGVLKTTDNEGSFTSYLTETTDHDASTVAILDSLDTAANGDYFYVGYSAAFGGVYISIKAPNSTVSTLTAQYWTGAAWASLTLMDDSTILSSATLAGSGSIRWQSSASMTSKTINGTAAFWVRFSVSVALDSEVEIAEIRVLDTLDGSSNEQRGVAIFRVRPAQPGDVRSQGYIWEEYLTINDVNSVAAMHVSTRFPHYHERSLLMATREGVYAVPITPDSTSYEFAYNSTTAVVQSSRDHCGSPLVNKQFLAITINGRNVGAQSELGIYYRVDDATTWTTLQINQDSVPYTEALSSVTGYRIQVKVVGETTGATGLPQEIESVEIRYRELPTTKNVYTMMLEVADNQAGPDGEGVADGSVQMSNLRTTLAASAVTLVDPLGTSKTVNVVSIREVEAYQDAEGYPGILCEVTAVEV